MAAVARYFYCASVGLPATSDVLEVRKWPEIQFSVNAVFTAATAAFLQLELQFSGSRFTG